MDKIIIRPEDGGECFTAFGQSRKDGEFYIADGETLEILVETLIPFAFEHELSTVEIDLSGFPGFSRRAS